jgi:hypothetical protein
MSENKLMQWYVFIDINEIFFHEFPIILTKWIEILVEKNGRYDVEELDS